MKPKIKVLCIFSNLLGLRTISAGFRRALDQCEDIEAEYFFLDELDYQKYPAPAWTRWSSTLELVFVARNKFRAQVRYKNFDILLINRFEFVLAFSDLVKKIPSILISDTTPKLAQALIRQADSGILTRLRSYMYERVVSFWCRTVFKFIRHFFPASDWCAESFIQDYHVDRKKVTVLYSPIDLEKWPVKAFKMPERPVLAFVGNDFKRKGGYFLIDLYQKYFQQNAELWIVSNEPGLSGVSLPPGVTLFAGLTHDSIQDLMDVYKKADIFVFPTYMDQLGIVIQEAMTSGLPVVVRNVGGTPNLIQDGHSGYLMSYESGEEEWAEKIRFLIEHPREGQRMGLNARKIAEEKFDQKKFNKIVQDNVKRMT